MQGNIILFMKTLQQSSWPLLSMYCLQLFARDSVSYTECQLDTGNDQQNYARPTIQCISNYSNSTSTIEKTTQFMGHHFIILHDSINSMSGWYFHDLSHMSVLPENDIYFPKKSGWSALPNVFMVEKAHFPCYNILLGSFSTWPSGTGSPPVAAPQIPLGSPGHLNFLRSVSSSAFHWSSKWSSRVEAACRDWPRMTRNGGSRRLLTMKTWIKHDQ